MNLQDMTNKELIDKLDGDLRFGGWHNSLAEMRRRLCSPKQPYTIKYK
jgi:hypothetical protein